MIPLNEFKDLRSQGLSDAVIADRLKAKGYTSNEISEALNQLEIKQNISSPSDMRPSLIDSDGEIPVPSPSAEEASVSPAPSSVVYPSYESQQMPLAQPGAYVDNNELIEAIIEEKWQNVVNAVGDIEVWKARFGDDLDAVKQELLRLGTRVDQLQQAVIGKVDDYNKNIAYMNSEIKALEQVLGKIIEPLTSNIKELNRITKDLKSRSS